MAKIAAFQIGVRGMAVFDGSRIRRTQALNREFRVSPAYKAAYLQEVRSATARFQRGVAVGAAFVRLAGQACPTLMFKMAGRARGIERDVLIVNGAIMARFARRIGRRPVEPSCDPRVANIAATVQERV